MEYTMAMYMAYTMALYIPYALPLHMGYTMPLALAVNARLPYTALIVYPIYNFNFISHIQL